ncbi:MAG: hypothetical protein GWN00_23650 [Aliifodinibius sp.]|nr:hypothetical protein [Candidatus Saccharibacteria bacterium]NIT59106.1 hypothetical protein [Fodinibius sp.]NIV13927.1 hypothetical protein [Fodinibius sp.]NIW98803.1 hypothetical protein [Phycisphaerae bacterium]NIY27689.1 hypothetical protein [Fodinibius sp.]
MDDQLKMLIQERIKDALSDRQSQRQSVLSELAQMRQIFQPQAGVFQAMGGSVPNSPAVSETPVAPEGGMTPEDYEYFVEIQKRNVLDPETQEKVGWNKSVRRFRKPTIEDLTDEGLKSEDRKKKTVADILGGY